MARSGNKIHNMCGIIAMLLLTAAGGLFVSVDGAAEAEQQPEAGRPVEAAVIICKGTIDEGLYKSIRRRTELALEKGVDYLIYEISTYGGLVNAADKIAKYLIHEVAPRARTVAYVATEAISAGAMISVSCQDIIMRENTTIGDCAPMVLGGKLEGVEREKAESFIRAAFMRAAEANGYPAALLKAMVTMQTEVYRVENRQKSRQSGKKVYEFFEGDQLPTDANVYDLENKQLIVRDSELLTLTASQAYEYGVAQAVVKDISGALEFLSRRDGVVFSEPTMVLKTNWSEEMVRWLNSPAVAAVLVMLALLGLYVELNTPGLGLPGLVAVVCFSILVGSKYLTGLANWVEVLLFVVGVVLLLVEILVLPGFGVAGGIGMLCILAGLFGMLVRNRPDQVPWPQTVWDWKIFYDGVLGLFLGFVGFGVAAWLAARYLPKARFLSGLILVPRPANMGEAIRPSMTPPVEEPWNGPQVGEEGEVVSTLRPTGKAKFGQAIVDVVAEGEFLAVGTKVKIVEVRGNRVVVRAIEKES